MQTCLESVKSCMWVGCMELSVIFKTGTLYLILRTLDQIHGLEVKTMCFKEITYQTVKTVSLCIFKQGKCLFVGACLIHSASCATRSCSTTRSHCLPHSLSACLSQPSD